MGNRYTRRPSDGEQVCAKCGSLVSDSIMHDTFHDRIDLLHAAVLTQDGQSYADRTVTLNIGDSIEATEAAMSDCRTPDDPCADPDFCDSLACARERLHLTLRDEADERGE